MIDLYGTTSRVTLISEFWASKRSNKDRITSPSIPSLYQVILSWVSANRGVAHIAIATEPAVKILLSLFSILSSYLRVGDSRLLYL